MSCADLASAPAGMLYISAIIDRYARTHLARGAIVVANSVSKRPEVVPETDSMIVQVRVAKEYAASISADKRVAFFARESRAKRKPGDGKAWEPPISSIDHP